MTPYLFGQRPPCVELPTATVAGVDSMGGHPHRTRGALSHDLRRLAIAPALIRPVSTLSADASLTAT
jgi:hypothetical protein